MRSKWIVFGILLAIGMMFSAPQNAQADVWAECSIDRVGQDIGSSSIKLTEINGAFSSTTFVFLSSNANKMLAVALTAISLGKNVVVRIQDDGVTINTIRITG